jgi:hypothetical protein
LADVAKTAGPPGLFLVGSSTNAAPESHAKSAEQAFDRLAKAKRF